MSSNPKPRLKPILFCFCAPIASGKTSICKELARTDPALSLSVSTTTRAPREGEVEGREYYFVSKDEFQSRVAQGMFLEHATVSGNYYGTELRNVDRVASSDVDLLLDIEYNGAHILKEKYGESVVVVFVFPPSFEVLKERLRKRGIEKEDLVRSRLELAKKEIEVLSSQDFSDYFIVNDVFDDTMSTARAIVHAERHRFYRYSQDYLDRMLKSPVE